MIQWHLSFFLLLSRLFLISSMVFMILPILFPLLFPLVFFLPNMLSLWAAFFNFAAVFFIGTAVAHTIGKGIIHIDIVDNLVILSALSGAIIWNITTWYYGLPSSSSHALDWRTYRRGYMPKPEQAHLSGRALSKQLLFIVVSPAIGMVLGFIFMVLAMNLSHQFQYGQIR